VTSELIADGKLAIGDGYRAKNSELADEGLPFARAGNIDGGFHFEDCDHFPEADLAKVGDKISRPGDVVFTSKGTVGRMAWVRPTTPRFVYAPQLCFWRSLDDSVIDSRWLYYWMRGDEFRPQMLGVKGQTDMADYVSLSDQRRMTITLPEVDAQRAVAAVLGSLDDKIEQNRRTARALERLARAIFRAWFVDFEPVKSKAAGATSFPSMPQAVFDALPTTFTDSDLGPVPEGWEVKSATEVAQVAIGKTPPRKEPQWFSTDPTNVPWVSIADMGSSGVFVRGTSEYLTPEAIDRYSVRRIPSGSVLFSFKLTVGRVAIADGRITSNEAIAHFVPTRPDAIGSEYLFCYLAEYDHTQLGSTSSIATATNSKAVKAMPVLVPPEHVSSVFTTFARPIFDCLRAALRENDQLGALRDYLLPKLMSGQVPVEVGDA